MRPDFRTKQTIRFWGLRLLAAAVTLFFILIITNIVFYVVPGDPARIMLGTTASQAEVDALRRALDLDRSWPEQIGSYLTGLFRGDLGVSLRFSRPVADLLGSRIPLTLLLSLEALLMALTIGLPLGLLSARRPGSALDTAVNVLTQTGLAIPSFFAAILLTLVLGLVFRGFQGVSYVDPRVSFLGSLRSLLVPAVAVALPRIAWVVQFFRQALIEQRDMDYVRTAKGKGLSGFRLIRRHVLRSALVPLVTTLGIILSELLAGSIVVEQVFNLPGLGRLLVTAVESRDFPLAQGIVLFIALVVVAVGLVVDVLNQAIDPRLRLGSAGRAG